MQNVAMKTVLSISAKCEKNIHNRLRNAPFFMSTIVKGLPPPPPLKATNCSTVVYNIYDLILTEAEPSRGINKLTEAEPKIDQF